MTCRMTSAGCDRFAVPESPLYSSSPHSTLPFVSPPPSDRSVVCVDCRRAGCSVRCLVFAFFPFVGVLHFLLTCSAVAGVRATVGSVVCSASQVPPVSMVSGFLALVPGRHCRNLRRLWETFDRILGRSSTPSSLMIDVGSFCNHFANRVTKICESTLLFGHLRCSLAAAHCSF